MGNCASQTAELNRDIHDRISEIDSKDVEAVANIVRDGWALYEKLSSDNRTEIKQLTKQHFLNKDLGTPLPALVKSG